MKLNYKKAPREFFESYHNKYDDERTLINPDWEWWRVKYHYNLVENDIMYWLLATNQSMSDMSILDIGGGTGHWLDFYTNYLESLNITMLDFSEVVVKRLRKKYPKIKIQHSNVATKQSQFSNKFDVINAIGVMFHLVDDSMWESAVINLCAYLKSGGVAIIGGEFGINTYQVSHHRVARSLEYWKSVVEANDCKIVGVKQNNWVSGISNNGIMDNTLAFTRR